VVISSHLEIFSWVDTCPVTLLLFEDHALEYSSTSDRPEKQAPGKAH